MLLDRSPAVFADRLKGWTSETARAGEGAGVKSGGERREGEERGKKAAFAVYEASADEGNDALANMLGEGIEDVEDDAEE